MKITILFAFMLSACGTPGMITLPDTNCADNGHGLVVSAEKPGVNCANGGTRIQNGICSPQFACDGSNGTSASVSVGQASPSQCSAGGITITTAEESNSEVAVSYTVTSVNTLCNGVNGSSGVNGQNGNSFSFSQTLASSEQCPAGGIEITVTEVDGNGDVMSNATTSSVLCDGKNGAVGQTGANGLNGVGVVFTSIPASLNECGTAGGTVIVMASDSAGTGLYSTADANQESTVICNGTAGQNGDNGTNGTNGTNAVISPFTIDSFITPCELNSSPYKENLICLADGSILCDFSANMAGDETRLAFLPVGSYEDTDASGCSFNVASDGNNGLTVSWGSGSNQYASWSAGSTDCIVKQ
jgi:hypothetical protein